jgi:hypothetical protein
MGICKAAWKLIYTTIKHHPGTVEVLIANKVPRTLPTTDIILEKSHSRLVPPHQCLEQLLDSVSTGAENTTIINGLHYLAKVLLLWFARSIMSMSGHG